MKTLIGSITTALALATVSQLAFATSPIEDVLQNVSDTPPQRSIGKVIENICPLGIVTSQDLQDRCDELVDGTLGVINPIGATDPQGARDGLQAMAPEEDAVVASSQVDAGSAQMNNIGDRLSAIRGGAGAGIVYSNSSGFNWSGGAAGDGARSPWGFFINGLYVTSDRHSTARESGFESDDYGVTSGIDYTFSDKVVLGAAFGYKNSSADIDANGGNLDTDSYSYFIYGSLYPDEAWYVDAMVGYTDNDHEQKRNVAYTITAANGANGILQPVVVNNSALSDTGSQEISFSLAAGRDFHTGSWTLSPYARFEYADIEIDGFTERMARAAVAVPGSGLSLDIDGQDLESMTATVGGTAGFEWQTSWGMVYPQATVEYTHEFKNDNEPITGRFVNDPSLTTFTLFTDPPDRNYLNVGAGMTATFTDNISGFFRYQGLVDYEDMDVHAFEFGIRVNF